VVIVYIFKVLQRGKRIQHLLLAEQEATRMEDVVKELEVPVTSGFVDVSTRVVKQPVPSAPSEEVSQSRID
jgi:hypothetical protein